MKKLLFFLALFGLIQISSAQMKGGGVNLPSTLTYNQTEFQLNGAGVRERFWISMYVSALYLEEKSQNAQAIMSADKPMVIRLHIVSKLITSKRMVEAVTDGFEKSLDGNTAPVQERIDKLLGYFEEDIKKDDVFDLVYEPGKGTTAYKNGEARGTVEGLDFKAALFGIWLSDDPADKDLKEEMLGN